MAPAAGPHENQVESIPRSPEAESPWFPTEEREEMFRDYWMSKQRHTALGWLSGALVFALPYLVRHFVIPRGKFPEPYGKAESEVTTSFLLRGIWEG